MTWANDFTSFVFQTIVIFTLLGCILAMKDVLNERSWRTIYNDDVKPPFYSAIGAISIKIIAIIIEECIK